MIERLLNLTRSLPWLILALAQTVMAGQLIAARVACNGLLSTSVAWMLAGSACGHWLAFYLSRKIEKQIEKLGEDAAP